MNSSHYGVFQLYKGFAASILAAHRGALLTARTVGIDLLSATICSSRERARLAPTPADGLGLYDPSVAVAGREVVDVTAVAAEDVLPERIAVKGLERSAGCAGAFVVGSWGVELVALCGGGFVKNEVELVALCGGGVVMG
jgi:hypothetical protein